MLMLTCWDGEERNEDAGIFRYTRIRSTFNRFINKNQRSTELREFAMYSFFIGIAFIESQSLLNLGIIMGISLWKSGIPCLKIRKKVPKTS